MYVETAAPPAELELVLRDVNRIRAAYDLHPLNELPRGQRCRSESCVLARAFGDLGKHVSVSGLDLSSVSGLDLSVVINDRQVEIELPLRLGEFAGAFDNGEYPHLEEKA